LPDFITSARRELMLSDVFFAFFGAIVALYFVLVEFDRLCALRRFEEIVVDENAGNIRK
jgi:hypothetical protein